jgi:hypothetical protein
MKLNKKLKSKSKMRICVWYQVYNDLGSSFFYDFIESFWNSVDEDLLDSIQIKVDSTALVPIQGLKLDEVD